MTTPTFKSLQPTTYKRLGMAPVKKTPSVLSNPCHNPAGPGGGQFCGTGSGGTGLENRLESDSLLNYQDNGYSSINAYLRNDPYEKKIIDKIKANPDHEAQVNHDIKNIDALFSKVKEKEINVYRADGAALGAHLFKSTGVESEMGQIRLGKAEHLYEHMAPNGQSGPRGWESYFNGKLSGQTFRDKAYVSTSTSQKLVADKFLNPREISPFGVQGLVSITGKTKSLDVDKLTGMKSGEKERLLPRNTIFRINRIELKTADRGFYFQYHVEVVK
jgi:hypothetical protein